MCVWTWRGVEDMETCRVELRGELAKDWLVDWVENWVEDWLVGGEVEWRIG